MNGLRKRLIAGGLSVALALTNVAVFPTGKASFVQAGNDAAVAKAQMQMVNGAIADAVAEIKKSVGGSWDDAGEDEKIQAVHDWLCKHVDYDYYAIRKDNPPAEDKSFSQSAYSVFVEKPDEYPRVDDKQNEFSEPDNASGKYLTICAGYAAGFALLCNHLGINTARVTSKTHAWNEVYTKDREWTLIDCTWDDDGVRRYNEEIQFPLELEYQYFQRTDDGAFKINDKIEENHDLESIWDELKGVIKPGYETGPEPRIYWKDLEGKFLRNGDDEYYVADADKIVKYECTDNGDGTFTLKKSNEGKVLYGLPNKQSDDEEILKANVNDIYLFEELYDIPGYAKESAAADVDTGTDESSDDQSEGETVNNDPNGNEGTDESESGDESTEEEGNEDSAAGETSLTNSLSEEDEALIEDLLKILEELDSDEDDTDGPIGGMEGWEDKGEENATNEMIADAIADTGSNSVDGVRDANQSADFPWDGEGAYIFELIKSKMDSDARQLYDNLYDSCARFVNSGESNYIENRGHYLNAAAIPAGMTLEEAEKVFWLFFWNNPQFYFLYNEFSIEKVTDVDGVAGYIWPYIYDAFADKVASAPTGGSSGSSSSGGNSSGSSSSTVSGSSSSGSSGTKSLSFSEGGTRTVGKGASKADYVKNGKASVTYYSSRTSYKAKTAKVPATVKIGKKTYKVTVIAANAFWGYDKLQTVVIGKNVRKIGKSAFYGCKNLKTLTINSKKLTKKGIKGALKDSAVRTVNVPADKVKAYKKIFTKKNTGSGNKIKVKAIK